MTTELFNYIAYIFFFTECYIYSCMACPFLLIIQTMYVQYNTVSFNNARDKAKNLESPLFEFWYYIIPLCE